MQAFGIIGLSDAGRMMPNPGVLASSKHVERFEHVSVIRFLFLLGHIGRRGECGRLFPRGESISRSSSRNSARISSSVKSCSRGCKRRSRCSPIAFTANKFIEQCFAERDCFLITSLSLSGICQRRFLIYVIFSQAREGARLSSRSQDTRSARRDTPPLFRISP